jgi:hypothetical protein
LKADGSASPKKVASSWLGYTAPDAVDIDLTKMVLHSSAWRPVILPGDFEVAATGEFLEEIERMTTSPNTRANSLWVVR